MPSWARQYFRWHQEARANITQNVMSYSWKDHQYLVVRCLHMDRRCGGGADRLKTLPLMLLLAHRTKRLLFYKWERPAPLEAFLEPASILNWTWPPHADLMTHKFPRSPGIMGGGEVNDALKYQAPGDNGKDGRRISVDHNIDNQQVVSIMYQSHNHGRTQYNALRYNNETEPDYEQVFRHIWNAVFRLAPPVQQRLEERLQALGLWNQTFHAVHIRSQYVKELGNAQRRHMVRRSIACLSELTYLHPPALDFSTPILIASDDTTTAIQAREYCHSLGLHKAIIAAANVPTNDTNNATTSTNVVPLHLDRGSSFLSRRPRQFTKHEPHEYYDVFVDLMIMSRAQCIVFGQGNFGRWANVLSDDHSCALDTIKKVNGSNFPCQWRDPNPKDSDKSQQKPQQQIVGRQPEPVLPNVTTRLSNTSSGLVVQHGQKKEKQTSSLAINISQNTIDSKDATIHMSFPVAPWRTSSRIPQWMKEYFQFHQDARADISKSDDNWKKYDYLVMRCLKQEKKCGGGADRLKSLPFLILVAHRLKRLLFYHWERPCHLEEFLLPPEDGLDWRWPPHPQLSDHDFGRLDILNGKGLNHYIGFVDPDPSNQVQNKRRFRRLGKIASLLFQANDHGAFQYDTLRINNDTDATYNHVFRDVWNSVFVPTPPIRERIASRMQNLGLVPNEYHAIHMRAQYIFEFSPMVLKMVANNAVSCLHRLVEKRNERLSSETPVFVTGDNIDAAKLAQSYAKSRGLERFILRLHNESEPILHLDRGLAFLARQTEKFTTHGVSGYYDVFTDLYLLANAKCVLYTFGNYGLWANLISEDADCVMKLSEDNSMGNMTHCRWPM